MEAISYYHHYELSTEIILPMLLLEFLEFPLFSAFSCSRFKILRILMCAVLHRNILRCCSRKDIYKELYPIFTRLAVPESIRIKSRKCLKTKSEIGKVNMFLEGWGVRRLE
jgi:hypothetical protein